MRSHFHAFARPPVIRSVAKASLAKGSLSKLILSTSWAVRAAPSKNPFVWDVIITRMSDGRTALNAAHDGLVHITIPVGILQCNCSIIGDPGTREALVVDPGDEVNRILDLLGRHKLIVKVIAITHAHIDHLGGLRKRPHYTVAPLLLHRAFPPLY